MDPLLSPPVALRIRVAPEPISITSWPLRDEPVKSMLMIVASGAVVTLVTVASQSFWVGIAAFILLGCTMWRTMLPITYSIGQTGVRMELLGRSSLIPWGAVQSIRTYPSGVLLLPDRQQNLFTPLRGVVIPLQGHKAEVQALLDYYLQQPDPITHHR
ncbi:hypothetical protein Psta_0511 [Pirellula staleyi DSM 6068]|uniref:PH domain-containing protein n=1 Tax=Pirellula staleyi (strain ATCC 27377 / DSM 6068 / ICPB 4128) TaxID=530564 RepID=D2R3G7_PIRSD|nr:hypothetical protein [Pirellula staleyi]ADB15198.1 hypothetical protein Psta_0511 [Pirellula staleyi DSM 6068]